MGDAYFSVGGVVASYLITTLLIVVSATSSNIPMISIVSYTRITNSIDNATRLHRGHGSLIPSGVV